MSSNRRSSRNPEPPYRSDFEAFYRAHYTLVSRYVARRLPSNSHDEVVAAVFVVAWRKFTKAAEPSLPWLYRIACYEVAHERRRLGREPLAGALHDLASAERFLPDDVVDISGAFNQLSNDDAELLRLVYWEELTRADIARVLGCSVNTVNVRYHRALERLSGALHRITHTSSDSHINNHTEENCT
jgi:RNA polymerase sigma factor (sigma-70 family)